jgi:hypothetical protein
MADSLSLLQQLSVLVAPFAGLVGALGGVLLGKRLDVQGQRDRWLREERLDAYSALLSASHDFTVDYWKLVKIADDEARQVLDGSLLESAVRIASTQSRVELLGPKPVVDAGTRLQVVFQALYDRADRDLDSVRSSLRDVAKDSFWNEADGALTTFLKLARDAVGIVEESPGKGESIISRLRAQPRH